MKRIFKKNLPSIILLFVLVLGSCADFLNGLDFFQEPEKTKTEQDLKSSKLEFTEQSQNGYSFVILFNPQKDNKAILDKTFRIYYSHENNSECRVSLETLNEERYSYDLKDKSPISITLNEQDKENALKNGLVIKYTGIKINCILLFGTESSGESGEDGGNEDYSVQTQHMTLTPSSDGVKIIVSVPDLYVSDTFQVVDLDTGSGFYIEPEYINITKSVEFIYPFCNANQEMRFQLHGDVRKNESDSKNYWLSEEAVVTSHGGIGKLNYSNVDKIKFVYSEDGDKGRYLSTENLNVDTIVSLFDNCNATVKIERFFNEFSFISGHKDWSDGTVWINGVTDVLDEIADNPTRLSYGLMNGETVNILDSSYWGMQYPASEFNEKASANSTIFFRLVIGFRIPEYNDQYLEYSDRICYAGSFITKNNESDEFNFTPAKLTLEDDQKGKAGDNISWKISNGVLSFNGSGAMWSYGYDNPAPWQKYEYSSVVFNEGITHIGWFTFAFKDSLVSVRIPASVESIDPYAFYGCSSLSNLVFEENSECEQIGNFAFSLTGITSVTIPSSVKTIGDYAFDESSLTTLEFEEDSKCEQIGERAFSLTGITSVTIPASVKTIGYGAFDESSLTTLEFEEDSNCEQIGNYAFCNTVITSVTIPSSVKTIGDRAFHSCSLLTTLEFEKGSNCDQIGEGAFYNTGITSVTIPASVKTIGEIAFYYCSSLTTLEFEKGSNCDQIGEGAFCNTGITSVTIPSSVKTIGDNAFTSCSSLTTLEFEKGSNCEQIGEAAFSYDTGITSVTIPASVKTIGDYAFYGIYTSNDWPSLTTLEFEKGSNCEQIGNYAFCNTVITSVTIPSSVKTIGDGAFHSCSSLTTLEFEKGSNCEQIGERAFYDTGITSVTIPASVKTIGDSAFSYCPSLTVLEFEEGSKCEQIGNYAFYNTGITSVTIPSSVTEINDYAFNDGTELNVEWKKSETGSRYISNSSDWIINYEMEEENLSDSVSWKIEDGVLYIEGEGAMPDFNSSDYNTAPWRNMSGTYSSVVVKDGITAVGNYAFCETKITSVTIPASVKTIGDHAFYDSSLTTLEFEENSKCEQIGNYAFWETKITSVTIPASVKTIGDYAFYYLSLTVLEFEENSKCEQIGNYAFYYTKITSVTIPASVKTIGDHAFIYCYSLTVLEFEENSNCEQIGNYAFYDTGITSVTIPASVKTIGDYAFFNTRITSVTIPASVKTIGDRAFYGCSSLSNLVFEENSKCEQIGYYAFCDTGITSVTIPSSVTTIGSSAFNSSCLLYVDWSMKDVLVNSTSAYIKYINIKGELSDSVSWKIEDGVLYIEGEGAMPDFNSSDNDTAPWRNMSGTYSSVVVKDGITAVGNYAFYNAGITSVTIPSSVTTIGSGAFYECYMLTDISLPQGLTSIGPYAFYSTSITEVTIPSSVQMIGSYAFGTTCIVYVDWYESQKENHYIDLNNSIIYRVNDSFTFTDGILTIDGDVNSSFFENTGIDPTDVSTLVIGKNTGIIENFAFSNCTLLEQVMLTESSNGSEEFLLKSIGGSAFSGCQFLSKVDLSGCTNLTLINTDAFNNCQLLEEVNLPACIENIESCAFNNCVNLSNINLSSCNKLNNIGSSAFARCSSLRAVTMPSSIESINSYAFVSCVSLTTVDFAACENLKELGSYVFEGCEKLSGVDLSNCNYLTSINYGAFYDCTSLKTIALPSSVDYFADETVFYNSAITEVDLSSNTNLKKLNSAFRNCESLTSIVLPASLDTIGDQEFYNCGSLAFVDISRATAIKSIGSNAFENTSVTSFDLSECTKLTSIGPGAFYDCKKLTSITLPEKITVIEDNTFFNCSSLSSINLTECIYITKIDTHAFYKCSSLTSMDLSNLTKLSSIGEYAFEGCNSLEKVVLPANLRSLDQYIFSNCTGLFSADLSQCSNITLLSGGTFNNCYSLTEFKLPSGITSIGYRAFYNCNALTTVDLSSYTNLTEFDAEVFCNCSQLEKVLLPCSVMSIASGIFDYTILTEIKWNCTNSEYDAAHTEELNYSEYFTFTDTRSLKVNYYSNGYYFTYPNTITSSNNTVLYRITDNTETNKLPEQYYSYDNILFLGWYTEPEFINKVTDLNKLFTEEDSTVSLYALWGTYYNVAPSVYDTTASFTETCQKKVYILPSEEGVTKKCTVYCGNTSSGLVSYCKPDVKMGFLVGNNLTVSENSMVSSSSDLGKTCSFEFSLFIYENGDKEYTSIVFIPEERNTTGNFMFNIKEIQ